MNANKVYGVFQRRQEPDKEFFSNLQGREHSKMLGVSQNEKAALLFMSSNALYKTAKGCNMGVAVCWSMPVYESKVVG